MLRNWTAIATALLIAACCPKPPVVDTSSTLPAATTIPAPDPSPGPPTREQILAASNLPEPLPAPLANDPLKVTIHQLSNGMTVYISTDREKPSFTAWVPVRAGSRHDPPDSTGLAHYLEHMLFKGTDEIGTVDFDKEHVHLAKITALYDQLRATEEAEERTKILGAIDAETQAASAYAVPNELDQIYSTLGIGSLNAFTWHEQTVYICNVPSNRLEAWAAVEAERFSDSAFRLFYTELETVYEEKNRSMDKAGSRISEALHKALYPNHPYGTQPTIGLVEHLKNPALRDMMAFFHRWYIPNNMAIALAGDIDAATAIPVLEKTFGQLETKPLEAPADADLSASKGRVQVDIEAEGGNEVHLAWRTVGVNHTDQPALEVMDWLVSNARAGLLDVELVLSQKLPSASASGSSYLAAGHWVVRGTAREGQSHADVEKLLFGVIAKLKAGDFDQADIDAVVLQAQIREMRELESNWARVAKMANAFIMRQPWSYAASRSERLSKLTKADVVRVANQYLGDDYVVIRRITGEHSSPKLDKPTITPIKIDPTKSSAFAAKIRAMPAKELEPEWLEQGKHYQRAKLPAGQFLHAKNVINELFSVSYRFEVGNRRQKLLCLALDLMEQSGVKGTSAEALQKKMYGMGTSINIDCSSDFVTLRVSGIDRNLEQSVQLLDQWLRTATLDQALLDKLVANRVSRRADTVKEPRFVSAALSSYARNDKESPYLLAPSNAALKRAKIAKLAKLLARLPDYQHETAYFGPRAAADVDKIVPLGKKHRKLKPRKPIVYRKARGVKIYFTHKDVTQAQISILIPKPPLPIDDRPVADLFDRYLGGGFGGLIFQEIREARGLAYSARAGHMAGYRPKDQSAVGGRLGTQADKTMEALTTMLDLIRNTPMQPDRLTKTHKAIDQRYRSSRVSPRSIVGWVRAWDDLGLASDPRPGWWATHKTLDEAALKSFAERFSTGSVIISIMADKARIDLEALNKIGKVEIVDPKKLFSY